MTEDIDWLTTSVLQAPGWRNIGPHRGGRVVAVAGDVRTPGQFYFGACAGGVWKTSDSGITWRNVSDGFFNTAAVGALAVSESDPNVIYAGTGETSIRNQVSHGDGVYRSTDGGRTWRHRGLSDTRHIGKIQIHPHDPDTVYVAALGHAFGPNSERGVFRSRDGGETWERVFHRSERSGTHDLAMDPNNPRILYAPSWQVRRYPHALDSGGEECGLHRSFDGGDTWEEISRRPGLPTGLLGKIGVAASRAQPGRVWALIEAEDGALFRSDDYGETWVRLSEQSTLRTRPWYYMHVTADPVDADTVYVQNYGIWKSTDAGATFEKLPSLHGDEHALWIHPADNRTMIKGDDGGGCVSHNGGVSWSTIHNQPTAQIYHVITDDQYPYRVYGSQQDNSAITVPSATDEVAIHERTWYAPGGGESGYIAIKPDEPWHVVASGPVGRRAYNDVMSHYDHRTGQPRNITVWPELFGWGAGAEAMRYRFQWTFPILFSPHAPHPLYVASNHLHRSDDLGTSFTVISPDLTRNDPEKLKASGGPITRDNTGAEVYCTIYALAESPQRQGVFWAGSDDGLVHLSQDGGETWQDITPPELPEWAMISIIELSPHRDGTAFVAATRYRLDDPAPYLFRTDDHGATWTLITSGIPGHEFTRVIREDPVQPNLLFAGTETGLYVSLDGGGAWERMGGGLPVVPVYDLAVKGDELVVAQDRLGVGLLDPVLHLGRVVPVEVEDGPVLGVVRVGELLPDLPAEVVHEPQLRAAVALGLDGLVAPLQEPLGVGERTLLLDVGGCGQEEDLCAYVLGLQFPGLYLRPVVPERGGLRLDEVAQDEPVEVGEGEALELAVGGAHGGVLAHDEEALAPAVDHAHDGRVDRVVPREAGQVVEAVVVLLRGRIPPIGLEEAHRVRLHVAPVAARRRVALHEGAEGLLGVGVGHRDVAGEDVVEGRDVRRALDGGVPAQRHDPAARPPDVPEQELDDRRGPDVLHPVGVLGPADRVGEGGGLLPARVVANLLAHPQEEVL